MDQIQKWKEDCKMRNIQRLGGAGFSGGTINRRDGRQRFIISGYEYGDENDEERRWLAETIRRDSELQRRLHMRQLRRQLRMRQIIPDQQAIMRNRFLQIPDNQPPPPPQRPRPVEARPVGNASRRLDFFNMGDDDENNDNENDDEMEE
jgi:hypothetical protein